MLGVPTALDHPPLRDLSLTSWRHAGHRTLRQRTVHRLALAKGFMIYEGLRSER
jgi:hypothetical protein